MTGPGKKSDFTKPHIRTLCSSYGDFYRIWKKEAIQDETDITRFAASPIELWRSILLTNTVEVNGAIESYITELRKVQESLATSQLDTLFDEANRFAQKLREKTAI